MIHAASPPLPLCTAAVVGLCCTLQLYVFLLNPPLGQFTLSALLVIYGHQYWRIVTSALFHGGFMHLAMNMMSTVALAGSLERSIGTLQLLFVICWQILLCGAFSVAVSWTLSLALLDDLSYLKQQSVGFSGVIFALAVVDIYRSSLDSHRSIFGFFSVPAKYYPWVLLVVLQVLIPNISFLGHLSGIMVGTLQAHGAFAWLLPSVDATRWLESVSFLRAAVAHPRFVPCSDDATANTHSMKDLGRSSVSTLRWGFGVLVSAAAWAVGVASTALSSALSRPPQAPAAHVWPDSSPARGGPDSPSFVL